MLKAMLVTLGRSMLEIIAVPVLCFGGVSLLLRLVRWWLDTKGLSLGWNDTILEINSVVFGFFATVGAMKLFWPLLMVRHQRRLEQLEHPESDRY